MKLSTLSAIFALVCCALAAPGTVKPLLKRNPSGSFSLMAYSLESSAIDIFYSDGVFSRLILDPVPNNDLLGIAYAGYSSKWNYGSVTTDVTCKLF